MITASSSRSLLSQRVFSFSQKRFNIREQLSRYHEPDKFKKHMLAACEPYYKPNFLPDNEKCVYTKSKKVMEHPLDIIYSDELIEEIKKTNALLVIQYNYTPFQSERVYKNTLTKLEGTFHPLNNRIFKRTFSLLERNEMIPLFVSRSALVTGDVEKLPLWVKALSKMPQFLLLAGSINGHIVERDLLVSISNQTDLDKTRSMLLLNLQLASHSIIDTLKRVPQE